MNAVKGDSVYLKHILECIEEIYRHSGGILETLEQHGTAWDATMRRLQIMAESTMRLSDKAKKQGSHIAWYKIKGFRNILVHEYLGDMDPEIIKGVVREYLPPLKEFCEQQLREIKD